MNFPTCLILVIRVLPESVIDFPSVPTGFFSEGYIIYSQKLSTVKFTPSLLQDQGPLARYVRPSLQTNNPFLRWFCQEISLIGLPPVNFQKLSSLHLSNLRHNRATPVFLRAGRHLRG